MNETTTQILEFALRNLNDVELSRLRDAIDERLPEGLRLQSHTDRLAGTLIRALNFGEIAVKAGLDGFSEEDTKIILEDHQVLKSIREALSQYKHFKEKQR